MAFSVFQPDKSDIRGVIFDMDGVILDTEKLYGRFWQEAAIALGYPMTRQQALGMRSLNRQSGQTKLEEYFGPGISHGAVRDKRVELMDAFIAENGVEAMPGVRETVTALHSMGISVAIATSSPRQRVEQYLGQLELLPLFPVICTGYDVPNSKPAPDIYLQAARMLALPPGKCLAVEDSPAGILSASRAGCLPIFIPDQDEADAKTRAMLYGEIDRLADLLELLQRQGAK